MAISKIKLPDGTIHDIQTTIDNITNLQTILDSKANNIPVFDLRSLGDFANYKIGLPEAELFLMPYDTTDLLTRFQEAGIIRLQFIYKTEHDIVLNLSYDDNDVVSGTYNYGTSINYFIFASDSIIFGKQYSPTLITNPTGDDIDKVLTINNDGEFIMDKLITIEDIDEICGITYKDASSSEVRF